MEKNGNNLFPDQKIGLIIFQAELLVIGSDNTRIDKQRRSHKDIFLSPWLLYSSLNRDAFVEKRIPN